MNIGLGGTFAVGAYFLMLVILGWASRRARKSNSLADFYLAGRGLGVPVLVLTLYAPQYSGNSLIGYRGEAYRMGFSWMMTVGFMMSIVVVYLTYAPKLQRISRGLGFVTPADWIEHRFGLAPLTHMANLLLVATITNYILAQLIAIGHITSGLTAGGAAEVGPKAAVAVGPAAKFRLGVATGRRGGRWPCGRRRRWGVGGGSTGGCRRGRRRRCRCGRSAAA